MSVEDVEQDRALVHVLDVFDLLGDVLGGGTNTSNRQEDVVLQEISREHLNVAGEGGGEHESLTALDAWHVLTLDDSADLGLETHVQHTISLVENEVLDVAQGDTASLDQIDKTTWGGNEKITATLDLTKLRANVSTTIDDAWSNPGSVCKLAGFVENLRDKFTGWCKDQGGGISLALTSKASSGSTRWGGRTCLESLGQDGEQETTSLSGTSLGTSHQIAAAHDDRDGVFLDWCRDFVVSELDVLYQVVIKRWVRELEDRLGNIVS
jgi:hypothetical protein